MRLSGKGMPGWDRLRQLWIDWFMYLLDTNVLSELVRARPHPQVLARFESSSSEDLFTSAVCIEEIRFGCRLVPEGEAKWRKVAAKVLVRVTVVEFDYQAAVRAGELRAEWKQKGSPVGYTDGFIAATALAADCILVTRNTRHFDHVNGLLVENWFESPPNPTSENLIADSR